MRNVQKLYIKINKCHKFIYINHLALKMNMSRFLTVDIECPYLIQIFKESLLSDSEIGKDFSLGYRSS